MNWLKHLFTTTIPGWFHTPAVQAVETGIDGLLPYAVEIVKDINLIAPNRTLTEINAIATKYALPAIAALNDGQTTGNVLLNLGTQILQKNHAPSAATSLLNTVIQLAVVGVTPPAVAPGA